MKMKNIIVVGLLPALTMLAMACSNDEEQTTERVPISLSASTLTAEETRTAADTTLNKDFLEAGQTVKVRVSNTGANTWTDYVFDAGNNGVMTASGIPPFYPLDGTNVDIVAYSPAAAGTLFSIHSDQTSPESYLASDLMFASATNKAKSNTAVPLLFEHKMAKIIITATAGAGVSTIEDVTLHNVLPQVTFNPATGAVGTALGTITSVAIVKDNNTSKAVGAAVIPAQAIDNELLTIKTNLGTATYTVNSKVFNAGRVYKLNISVNRAAVNATTAINGWTDTASASVNKEEASKVFTLVDSNGGHRSFTMIRVEGGPYTTLAGRDVTGTLSSFYIGQLEVTNFLWWMIMRALPEGTKDQPYIDVSNTYPVEFVTWSDVNSFIALLNEQLADQLDGMQFRLPTEAQWEYAARGGINQERYTYSGGNRIDWFCIDKNYNAGKPRPCGDRYANSLGIYDMSGNVWEFCSDNYRAATELPTNLGLDYAGPATGNGHVVRGGGFQNDGSKLEPNYEGTAQVNYLSIVGGRWPFLNTEKSAHVGLRLALQ
jgi:formylglycine-generating enzyme required for sulfatase activity